MSIREKQQMKSDTESATHTGMEGPSRCSHKYLLLQVWCGLLTVSMVVMAAFLTSIKPKSTEDEVSTLKPENVSPTVSTFVASLKSAGSSRSYIQLETQDSLSSQDKELPSCESCSLLLRNNSIHCTKTSLYFIYAQVTFRKKEMLNKSVVLTRDASFYRSPKTLVESIFPDMAEGSVWVAKVVQLKEGDSVSLNITGDFISTLTFWGAYQLL